MGSRHHFSGLSQLQECGAGESPASRLGVVDPDKPWQDAADDVSRSCKDIIHEQCNDLVLEQAALSNELFIALAPAMLTS